MDPWIVPSCLLAGSYLLGSIPFGIIVTRLAGTPDLRGVGSGNIGATNVLRTGRKELAAITLILDATKGAAAVLIAHAIDPDFAPLGAVGAFYGHIFPVWLRFHGGKGIATFLGLALALYWPIGLMFAAAWIALMAITRTSSIAGIGAALIAPVAAAFFYHADLAILFLALALTVLWTHRANIGRLLSGSEPRVGAT